MTSLIYTHTYSVGTFPFPFCTSAQITTWLVELSQYDGVNKILSSLHVMDRDRWHSRDMTESDVCSNGWWGSWGVQWLECGVSIGDSTVCVFVFVLRCVVAVSALSACDGLRSWWIVFGLEILHDWSKTMTSVWLSSPLITLSAFRSCFHRWH